MDVIGIEDCFVVVISFDFQIDEFFLVMQDYGFDMLIYDYIFGCYDFSGEFMIFIVLELCNVDEIMCDYWCWCGYFCYDFVQYVVFGMIVLFFWNYDFKVQIFIYVFMNEEMVLVVEFFWECGLMVGVIVLIYLLGGDYVIVIGICVGDLVWFECDVWLCMGDFSLIVYFFQWSVVLCIVCEQGFFGLLCLIMCECECLCYLVEGYLVKEIFCLIDWFVLIVVMYFNVVM